MDLSEKMNYEIERLQHTRAQYERWLESAPEGSLYFHNNERGAAWLYRAPDSEKARYLSKTEVKLAEKLELEHARRPNYPDFTILNPNNGKTYYYEHFGMMDDPNYQQDFLSKMRTFLNNGIYPGVNLIMSFETKDTPIDEVYVNHLLEYYFGNVMEKR